MRSTAYLRSAGLVLGLGMAALLAGCLSGSGSSSGSGLLPGPSMPDIPEERVLPLIFVHGTAGSASQYQTQAMRFSSNGYPDDHVLAFEYSTAGIGEVTRALTGELSPDLDAFIDQVLSDLDADQVYLACHSLGTAVCGYYLTDPARAAKVAGYVAIDGATGENCPGNSNCMGIFVSEERSLGSNNAYFPDETHVQVATSEASFAAQFEFFTGVEPERVRILPARGDVNISGRAVYFPANSGAAGTELQIWEVDADTGERLGDSSLANFNIGSDGRWGPVRLDPEAHYEFLLLRPDRADHHFYRQPLIRDSHLVRLNTSPAGSEIELNTHVSDDHAALVISRDMEWWGDRGADNDVLEISTTSASGDQAAVDIISSAMGSANIGIHVHDDEATPLLTSGEPLPYFPEQPFQWGVDVYMPAAEPPDGTISIVSSPRGDTANQQILNVPNWASSGHRISLIFNDYQQD